MKSTSLVHLEIELCTKLGLTPLQGQQQYDEYCEYVVSRGEGKYMEYVDYLLHLMDGHAITENAECLE